MQRPELRGYARIALAVLAAELDPIPGDLTSIASDLLALACGDANPDPLEIAAQLGQAVPEGAESWIFGLMSHSSHPDVARVLMVLGRYHPDLRIAKDARHAARASARNRMAARAGNVTARRSGR